MSIFELQSLQALLQVLAHLDVIPEQYRVDLSQFAYLLGLVIEFIVKTWDSGVSYLLAAVTSLVTLG